ncbi:MAG: 50S ribosomal protein L30 [Clostridiales bacterium]|jgi:large subunit ribosomal protein L30|nr:50S ribosomal protein L30 [Clostridiales bacterium]
MEKLKITLTRSTIGLLENQKANVAALGLKKIGQSKVHNDSPHIRGMIKKVSFLLKIEEIV